jgi:acetate---CoA ligase (ADP-forming)
VVMITGGYAEVGKGDVEAKIARLASMHGMRILGPNTIGLVDTWSGVDSLFLRQTKRLASGEEIVSMLKPLRGEIAIITQSGHLGEVIAEDLASNGVGVRAIVGTGNQLDVSVEDVIQYFSEDQNTKVIVVYLEGVRDGRRFMETAASAVKKKPVVVFKVGKTGAGARAALTHTASLVGDYEIYRAAFRQCGVIEAKTVRELVDYAISLQMLPRAPGKRLVIITNAGGVGAVAADEAARLGLQVDPPRPAVKRGFQAEFEGASFVNNASLSNPIDLTASVTSDEFVRAAEFFLKLREYDLALLLPTHHAPGMAPDVALRLSDVIVRSGKPVACGIIGNSPLASKLHSEFMANKVPSFPTPEQGVGALAAVSQYASSRAAPHAPRALSMTRKRRFGRTGPLSHQQVSDLLRSHAIPEPRSRVVKTERELLGKGGLRFPVACKLLSKGLPHKSDVGGVVLGVPNAAEARQVFGRFERLARRKSIPFEGMLLQEMSGRGVEVILGGLRDPTFGPVVMVGLGGTYTELLRTYSLAVAPVSPAEVGRMLSGKALEKIMSGYRGSPKASTGRLSRVVSGFSSIMIENPEIDQMEINPLIVTENSALAVDARATIKR